jgi:hypothetical protein
MASGGSDGAVLLWRRVDDPATSTRHEWVVVAAGSHGAPVTDVCALAMSGGGGHPGDANEGVEGAEKKAWITRRLPPRDRVAGLHGQNVARGPHGARPASPRVAPRWGPTQLAASSRSR